MQIEQIKSKLEQAIQKTAQAYFISSSYGFIEHSLIMLQLYRLYSNRLFVLKNINKCSCCYVDLCDYDRINFSGITPVECENVKLIISTTTTTTSTTTEEVTTTTTEEATTTTTEDVTTTTTEDVTTTTTEETTTTTTEDVTTTTTEETTTTTEEITTTTTEETTTTTTEEVTTTTTEETTTTTTETPQDCLEYEISWSENGSIYAIEYTDCEGEPDTFFVDTSGASPTTLCARGINSYDDQALTINLLGPCVQGIN